MQRQRIDTVVLKKIQSNFNTALGKLGGKCGMFAPDFFRNLYFQFLHHICPKKTYGANLYFCSLSKLNVSYT